MNGSMKERLAADERGKGDKDWTGLLFTAVDMTAVNSLRFPRKECFLAAGTESEGRQVAGTRTLHSSSLSAVVVLASFVERSGRQKDIVNLRSSSLLGSTIASIGR
jgi:hypothetical protein